MTSFSRLLNEVRQMSEESARRLQTYYLGSIEYYQNIQRRISEKGAERAQGIVGIETYLIHIHTSFIS